MNTWIDGHPSHRNTQALYNRGLLYGDGLFETLAVYAGQALLVRRHLERLERGCRRLGMVFPGIGLLTREMQEVCQGRQEGVLKLLLCRAFGEPGGYQPEPAGVVVRILSLHPWRPVRQAMLAAGAVLRTCAIRLGMQPWLAGIKHLNRLEQVLAAVETAGSDEGLMLDTHGRVVEGVRSNLFIVERGHLYTPPLYDCGVAGVMRETVLDLARGQGLVPVVAPLLPVRLPAAEEVFIANSLIGVVPVASVDGQDCRRGRTWDGFRQALVEAGAVVPA